MSDPHPIQDVLSTLQEFKAAQERRMQQYAHFNRAFLSYLSSGQEGPYRYAAYRCVPAPSQSHVTMTGCTSGFNKADNSIHTSASQN
jgi:hypothetical protein